MQVLTSKNGLDARSDYLLQWLDADTDAPVDDSQLIANGGTPAGGEDDQGFAARLYRLCLHALRKVYIQNRGKRTFGSPSTGLRECLGRLYLWGESFGKGELDKALEESDDLKESVLERLGHIGKLLLHELPTTNAPSRGLPQPSKQTIELESLIKQTNDVTSGHKEGENPSGNDGDEDYDSGTEGFSDGESYDLCEDICFSITCLAELRDSLEQNLIRAEKNRSQNTRPPPVSFCLSDPAKIYVSLVREKFRQAEDQLVERLGQANWQRHVGVRKRIESHIGIIEDVPEPACSVFRLYSTFHDSGIGTSVPTQTSYAPSHTSFISSNPEGGQDSLRVPPMPSAVGVCKPFECDFCGMLLSSIKNRVEWKMHVFADLQPYVCTFANCEDELSQFPTRAAWSDHEFAEHRVTQQWSCPECPNIYARTVDWEDHLQRDHQCFFTGSKLQVALGMALHRKSRTAENEECPLCRTILGKPRRAFVKHVGRHMEEIALMALPQNAEDDSNEGSISSNEKSASTVDTEMAHTISSHERYLRQKELYAAARKVLSILLGDTQNSTPFLTPMNPQKTPDYYNSIKTPMDLGTVKDKLENYRYMSKVAFVRDLNLIWANCLGYNTARGQPHREKALAMRQKTEELVPSIPNVVIDVLRFSGQPSHDPHILDDIDSDNDPITSSKGQLALASKSTFTVDRVAPVNLKPSPQIIEGQDIPEQGSRWVHKDSTTRQQTIDGEAPSTQWGVTKAGKPRKRLINACMSCRKRKIKCDAAKPNCVQCERLGKVCEFSPARLNDQTQKHPGPISLKDSHLFASSDDHRGAYEDPAHGAATHHDPVLSVGRKSKTTLQQPKDEVEGSMSPANKKHQCPYCSTSFTRHQNLKSHLLTHNQDEPYACDTCETRFRRLHDLKRHNKVHTGERPHVCLKCNRSFARADRFVSHTKNGCTYVGGRSPVHDISSDDELHEMLEPTENYRVSKRHVNGDIEAKDQGRGSVGYLNDVKIAKETLLTESRADVNDVELKPRIRMPPGGAPTDSWVGNGWSSENDQTLLLAREKGLDWHTIVSQHFPETTSNAIRNQYARLLASNEVNPKNLSDREFLFTQQQNSIPQPNASQIYAQKLAKSPPQESKPTQERRVCSQQHPNTWIGSPTISHKDSLYDNNTVQNYAKGFLNDRSTSDKGEHQQGDRNDQNHPSLTRERHSIYGNSIFSENRSVYRTDDTSDRFKDSVFERELAKGGTLSTYTYPGGRGKGQKTRSTSVDVLEDRKSSREPSDVEFPATSGSAYKLNDSTYGDDVEQSGDPHEKFKCSHTGCVERPPLFSTRFEWAEDMDLHVRTYLCVEPECKNLLGFRYARDLLRHRREVHEVQVDDEIERETKRFESQIRHDLMPSRTPPKEHPAKKRSEPSEQEKELEEAKEITTKVLLKLSSEMYLEGER